MTPVFPADQYARILGAGNLPASRAIVALAGLAGLARILHDARAWPLDARRRVELLAAVFGGGMIGAALPAFAAGGWVAGLAVRQGVTGPKTIVGALAAGFFGAAIYKRVTRIDFDTSDAFAPGTALMMAIGRLGCFVNHCCFGIEWHGPGGMDFGDGVPRFPVQLLEAFVTFGVFLLIAELHRRDALRHRRLFAFLGIYGVERFVLEFLRAPISWEVLGLNAYQWMSVALIALAGFQIVRRAKKFGTDLVPVRPAAHLSDLR